MDKKLDILVSGWNMMFLLVVLRTRDALQITILIAAMKNYIRSELKRY